MITGMRIIYSISIVDFAMNKGCFMSAVVWFVLSVAIGAVFFICERLKKKIITMRWMIMMMLTIMTKIIIINDNSLFLVFIRIASSSM